MIRLHDASAEVRTTTPNFNTADTKPKLQQGDKMWRHEKQLILKAAHTYGIRTYRTRTLLFLVNYVPYAYAIFCCNVRSNFGRQAAILYNGWTIFQQLYQIATQSVTFATFESIIIWVQSERQTRFCKKNTWLYCAKCMVLLHLHYEQ